MLYVYRYFEADSDEEEPQRPSRSKKQESSDSEEDPLDAFMAGIQVSTLEAVKETLKGQHTHKKKTCAKRKPLCEHSLGRADVRLRHARGKTAENAVYACALLSAHTDTHGTKGKKGTISRMSDHITHDIIATPKSHNRPFIPACTCLMLIHCKI